MHSAAPKRGSIVVMRSTIVELVILTIFLSGAPIASSQGSDTANPAQISGTVVDTSGAAIAEATVKVRSADDSEQRTTQSDRDGVFIVSGLAAGNYRLVVSRSGFETKEVSVTIETSGTHSSAARLIVGGLSEHHDQRGRPRR